MIVGIGFRARSGKDTLARMICDRVPGARIYGFADDLKAYARVLGMQGKDPVLLQHLGTGVFRRVDPNIWVRCLAARIEEEKPRCAVVSDMRFPNEMYWIRREGGVTVRVDRLTDDGTIQHSGDRDPQHRSETALETAHFDYHVAAPSGQLGALEEMARTVADFVQRR